MQHACAGTRIKGVTQKSPRSIHPAGFYSVTVSASKSSHVSFTRIRNVSHKYTSHAHNHAWTDMRRARKIFFPSRSDLLPFRTEQPLSSLETAIPHLSLHLLIPQRVTRKLVRSHPLTPLATLHACAHELACTACTYTSRLHTDETFSSSLIARATSTEITKFFEASTEKLDSTECSYSAAEGINDNVITAKSCMEYERNCSEFGDKISFNFM